MIEFSDAPYQFFPAKPFAPLIWLTRRLNGSVILPGKNHRVTELEISGETEALMDAKKSGARLMFVMNHPSHSDPQIVSEVHRRLGIRSCFMAAYDVFLRGKMQAMVMQRTGNFSIDRDGSDRKAMAAAIDILKAGTAALNVFPEGNVYLTNDRVTPFMDGAAFIALKAQQALDDVPVKIIPMSLKLTHLTEPREELIGRMQQLAADSGYIFPRGAEAEPVKSVLELGRHIAGIVLASALPRSCPALGDGKLHDLLHEQASELIVSLEEALSISENKEAGLSCRIAKVRSKIHQAKIDPQATPSAELNLLSNQAILALRLHGYTQPYLAERQTLDRFDETVERLAEDFYSMAMPRTGPRKALVEIGELIDVREEFSAAGSKLRPAISAITERMEKTVQGGVDRINSKLNSPEL